MENSRTFCNDCNTSRFLIEPGRPPREKYAVAVTCPSCAVVCDKCKGNGYVVSERNGYEFVSRCSCQNLPIRIAQFNNALIPARYYDKLSIPLGREVGAERKKGAPYQVSESQERAQSRIDRWAREYSPGARGLLLMGPPGTGKTLLLCQILRHLTLRLGERCRFVEFSLLLDEMREQIGARRDGGEAAASLKSPLRDATVLVIDELGKVRGTEWEMNELDSLISLRYQAGKTTLFATNYTTNPNTTYRISRPTRAPRFGADDNRAEKAPAGDGETLSQRLGARIFSRLQECCEFIEIFGADYRQRGAGL